MYILLVIASLYCCKIKKRRDTTLVDCGPATTSILVVVEITLKNTKHKIMIENAETPRLLIASQLLTTGGGGGTAGKEAAGWRRRKVEIHRKSGNYK